MSFDERVQKTISRYKTFEAVLKLVGWWTPLAGITSGLAWAVWAWMLGLPSPVLVLGAVTLAAAVAFGLLFPKFATLLARGAIYRKPDYSIWRHTPILHIRQAACLFADVGWVEGSEAPYPENARIWAHHIAVAVETHRLRPVPDFSLDDTKIVVPVNYETKVAVNDLRVWAKEEGIEVPFFSYLESKGISIPRELLRHP
jgi:hypothetical protein